MEAFEPIRDAASHLHDEVVSAGADALNPAALAEAAIQRLDLELAWLPPGDPALKGARAIYDQQSGTICCADAGSPSERALLVAHEIGHAHIHTVSSECAAEEVDPSRSTEAAP